MIREQVNLDSHSASKASCPACWELSAASCYQALSVELESWSCSGWFPESQFQALELRYPELARRFPALSNRAALSQVASYQAELRPA